MTISKVRDQRQSHGKFNRDTGMYLLSLPGLYLFMLFRCFFLSLFFTSQILWKNSLRCMFIVFTLFNPHILPTTADFCIRPFPNDSTVLCVHDQGECLRLYVGVETTRRPPPVGHIQKRVPLASRATPLSLTDSLKTVAMFPPPLSAAPPSTWMPSSAINIPN